MLRVFGVMGVAVIVSCGVYMQVAVAGLSAG